MLHLLKNLLAMLTDIAISQSAPIRHIKDIAAATGINNNDLEYYEKHTATFPLKLIDETLFRQHHLVLVTAITPTPADEGKTTISV